MHRGGPYWLPPRRAPFGRRAGQPSKGAPTRTARSPRASEREMSPFAVAGRRAHDPGLRQNPNTESCDLFHPGGHTEMARNWGTKLGIVAAEACGAGFRANGDGPPRVVRLP